MNELESEDELLLYIKSIISKYCPYIENRLFLFGNANQPQFDIEIDIKLNQSKVRFLFGNHSFKQSVHEQAMLPYTIEFDELKELIDFILSDHEIIKSINFYNNKIDLKFAINWTDSSIKGINCGDISLNLNFDNIKLNKQYLYLLFENYYNQLNSVPSFKKIKNQYISDIKKSYFNNLSKNQIISFLNEMSENELRELLYSLDNDLFIEYTTHFNEKGKTKKMILEIKEKNE